MALRLQAEKPKKPVEDHDEPDAKGEGADGGPNEDIHEPVDAAAGYAPRVVKVPMHDGADVNPEIAQKQERALRGEESEGKKPDDVKKGAGWNDKDERMFQHIKDSGASEKIAAATVNKQRSKEGRLLHPKVKKADLKKGTDVETYGAGTPVKYVGSNGMPRSTMGNPNEGIPRVLQANPTNQSYAPKEGVAHGEYGKNAQGQTGPGVPWKSGPRSTLTADNNADAPPPQNSTPAPAPQVAKPDWYNNQANQNYRESHARFQAQDAARAAAAKPQQTGAQPMVATKSTPNVKLIMKGGAGSRGGKIAYYTKSGAAVYQSKVAKMAPQFSAMAHNWSNNAGSGHRDHHATAAKQHYVAAFYQHHAGNSEGAKEHLKRGDFHHASAKFGHKLGTASKEGEPAKRTMSWIEKHKKSTHDLVHGTDTKEDSLGSHHGNQDAAKHLQQTNDKAARERIDMKKSLAEDMHDASEEMSKSLSNSIGGNNMKNEVEDLFKSELGASNAEQPITKCVHCGHDLTKSDLRKGLGTHFVADDNDNPTSGGSGQVEPSRPAGGVAEHDVIAPLLKGLKGSDAGDGEEFIISKSEMNEMGMKTEGLDDDGFYTITKGEMKRLGCEQHIGFLADRKTKLSKSDAPNVIKKGGTDARATQDGPHGYSPRAGGVIGNDGNPLVQWVEGSDKQVAEYISKSGGYGPGTDESVKTQGRGYGEG